MKSIVKQKYTMRVLDLSTLEIQPFYFTWIPIGT